MLTVIALLTISADPAGLKNALELADQAEVFYFVTDSSKTLKQADLKNLAKRVDCTEQVEIVQKGGSISTKKIFKIQVKRSAMTQWRFVIQRW